MSYFAITDMELCTAPGGLRPQAVMTTTISDPELSVLNAMSRLVRSRLSNVNENGGGCRSETRFTN